LLSAVWPESAVTYSPPAAYHAREFVRMVQAGIIQRTQEDQYYFDQFAFSYARKRFSKRAVPWVIFVSIAIAWIATRFYVDASQDFH